MGSITTDILQYLFSGITIGAIYAMVGLGFTMVYNSTSIINLAQGEFVMLGGLLGVTCVASAKASGMSPPVAVVVASVLAVGGTTLVGLLMEKLAIEPTDRLTVFHYGGMAVVAFWLCRAVAGLSMVVSAGITVVFVAAAYLLLRNRAIESMRNPTVLQLIIITIALSILIRGVAMFTFGKDPYFMDHFVSESPIRILGATVLPQTLLVVAVIAAVVVLVGLFFGLTLTGKAMQACAFNREIAKLMGINDRWMILLSFGMSAFVGAVAGYVVTPITLMDYDRGPLLALKGFGAAVLGGLGNGYGAVAAGFILGILEALGAGLVSSGYKDAISLIILLAVLFYRPSGLFGSAEAARFKEF
ncbi:MAG: branched-chain amino acid ABC transporter permease [Deltaproteobacteria bacterium]|nr:branched-chain amino acid ABC transporter permease [Deltaproteobacteria bacterium]